MVDIFCLQGPFLYKSLPLMKIKTAKVSKCVCQEMKVLCKHRQTKQTVVQDREWKQSSITRGVGEEGAGGGAVAS